MQLDKKLILVLVTAVLLATAASIAALRITGPRFVSFDLRGTLETFAEQSAEAAHSEEQSQALADRFGKALDASLNEYQQGNGAIILVKSAVVAGTPDITEQIQQAIAAKMQRGPEP